MLRVAPGGSKQWLWRGTVKGRGRDYGLGAVRYTSLAEARRIAFEYRKIARQGGNPKVDQDGGTVSNILGGRRGGDRPLLGGVKTG